MRILYPQLQKRRHDLRNALIHGSLRWFLNSRHAACVRGLRHPRTGRVVQERRTQLAHERLLFQPLLALLMRLQQRTKNISYAASHSSSDVRTNLATTRVWVRITSGRRWNILNHVKRKEKRVPCQLLGRLTQRDSSNYLEETVR